MQNGFEPPGPRRVRAASLTREQAMPIIDDMELPIEPLKMSGPAVCAQKETLEENDNERAEVAQFEKAYAPVKDDTLTGLASLASISFS
jgi:hypothetical protein